MNSSKALSLLLMIASAAAMAESRAPVGQVTLAVGYVTAFRADGSSLAIKRGGNVFAGDRLETSGSGHVHVRFVDGGVVSLRPSSRLLIGEYRGEGSRAVAIKFVLEQGVVRSVTGKWGQADREKFRLNTPVAAIGIKGTDFVVKVDGESTQASVFTGSIAMSPLTPECANALGACEAAKTVTLAADMKGLMLQLTPQTGSAPVLAPAIDLLAGRTTSGLKVADNGVGTNPVADSSATETTAVAEKVTRPRPLVWLHNKLGWNVPGNTISRRFDEALASGMRPVVGDLFITLYRDEAFLKQYQPIAINQVSFKLNDASATYQPGAATGRPIEIATISSAALSVDFARSTYATHLSVSAPYAGPTTVNMSGQIDANGRFVDRNVNTSIAGSLSLDGKEAAYMFNQAIGLGSLSGLTLWGQ